MDVSLMRFSKKEKIFKSYTSFSCETTPHIGEKIVFDVDGVAQIFEVIDIHYNLQANAADIFLSDGKDYIKFKECFRFLHVNQEDSQDL